MSNTVSPDQALPLPEPSGQLADLDVSNRGPRDVPLRLWPAVVILGLQWTLVQGTKIFAPGTMTQFIAMFWGPIVGGLAFSIWWLFASRLPVRERWLLFGANLLIAIIAYVAAHPSVGLMGLSLFGLPAVTTGWAIALLMTSRLGWPARRTILLATFAGVWGYFCLVRFDGTDGSLTAELAYRWVPTAEETFLAEISSSQPANHKIQPGASPEVTEVSATDWPEFRGPARDGRRPGTKLATDWTAAPPKELWSHRIGPGWSSFAVIGNRIFTQEQRGTVETVVCYDAATGAEQWVHRDEGRFEEVVAGPGPRATPTFHEGRLYTQGAKGCVNCLDAANGNVVWKRDIVEDSGAKVPQWGFSASPLVFKDLVVVYAGGPEGKGVLAYHRETGGLAWSAESGQFSYCSLQKATVGGVDQLVIATDAGLMGLNPADGKKLWQHDWQLQTGMARVVQPAQIGESDFLLGTSFGYGTRRVRVTRAGDVWKTEALWTTTDIKPYYNDLVVHRDHAYGFDGNIFVCINLADGKRKWRTRGSGNGYGNGQVLLLSDQDLLLLLTEKGEVALLATNPDRHEELGRFEAIEGKTWNHPVLAGNRLFVRNGEKIACYQLPESTKQVASTLR